METKLKISEKTNVIAKNIKVTKEGQVNKYDMLKLAIQIGKDNKLYNKGHWDDINKQKCYNKAHEII